MKKILLYIVLLFSSACMSFDSNPYDDTLRTLKVQLIYPEGSELYLREGVQVMLNDRHSSSRYIAKTDASGIAEFQISASFYRLAIADLANSSTLFSGGVEQVSLIDTDGNIDVKLKLVKPGTILIKELYTSGCEVDPPATGTFTYDKYVILHNNTTETLYLDGLCLGMVAPYNSNASNPWTSVDGTGNIVFRDYAAVVDCIWWFEGSGTDFPIESGADAVIAIMEGVDHTQTYSKSVNLNQPGFYVMYDQLLYPGPSNHQIAVPGDQIDRKNYLKVLKKTGNISTTTYTVSIFSPAMILFRAPEEVDLGAYLADDKESTITNGSINYSKVPWEWIIDGIDVCNRSETTKNKRLHPDIDGGFADFTAMSQGHTLHRHLNEMLTEIFGYEYYTDTNNSSNDFYERETQSLRK